VLVPLPKTQARNGIKQEQFDRTLLYINFETLLCFVTSRVRIINFLIIDLVILKEFT